MQTIGLLGGMSWESTVPYYRIINETVRQRWAACTRPGSFFTASTFTTSSGCRPPGTGRRPAKCLPTPRAPSKRRGADFLVLCTNTMHKVAPAIDARRRDSAAAHRRSDGRCDRHAGLSTVGLLGTRFTMEQEFYRDRLALHGIDAIVPDEDERECVHRVIYDELCRGIVRDDSRTRFRSVIERLVARGAQGVVLGCTEIAMLVGARDAAVPVFDTALIHARAAAMRALTGELAPSALAAFARLQPWRRAHEPR